MTAKEKAEALENRLIDFAVRSVKLSDALPKNYAGQHFGRQVLRSGSAPALLYGEARGSESSKDFRHKASIIVKELRETHINLRILQRSQSINYHIDEIIQENNELISIFVATIKTLDYKIRNGLK